MYHESTTVREACKSEPISNSDSEDSDVSGTGLNSTHVYCML